MPIREYVPYTKNVNVTEHRAPTEDSIRLYKEMEEKAERSIIAKERFEDNELNGIITYTEITRESFDVKAHIRFSLNKKDYHNIVMVPRSFSIDRQRGLELLYKSIIAELAKTFTIEFANNKSIYH